MRLVRILRMRTAALCGVGLLAVAPAVQAGTLAQRELGLALEESRTDGNAIERGSVRLRAALAALRAENARMRRTFDTAASRPLPPPAARRLEASRDAYEQGQGRLADLVDRALASRRPDEREVLLEDARALHARIEAAALAEPVSAAPRVRPAQLVPPPLPFGNATGPATAPDAIGSVPATLRDAAAALAGPIEVFEWVRNEVRAEFYHGQMKGALATFTERAGNDADTAAVLVEMLRAKGIPARYVRGVAELPAAGVVSMTGTSDVTRALRVLERAGIPHEPVTGPGGVTAVRIDRVWVEAYVPYANYRGAVIDAEGSVWIRLDAAYKATSAPAGLDVVATLGFDAREARDAYIATSQPGTPLESIRAQVAALLAVQLPGTSYEDVLNRRVLEAQRLGLLPSTLPYKVVSVAGVSYDVDESLRHRVRLLAEDGEGPLFDVALDTADVHGRRVTLAYEPETDEDRQVIASYGGLSQTPPYLVRLRPVVKVGGIAAGAASRGIGMGIRYDLRIETTSPGGTEAIINRVLAGNLVAIGFAGRTASTTPAGSADGMLATVAARYLERWDASDEELAALLRVVPVRPTLSACLVFSDVEVEYAGGDPLYPVTFEWKGVLIDADLRPSSPAGLESDAAEARFLMLSGLEGSVLEERVLSQDLRIPSVSTAGVLGLAAVQGLTVHALTRENVDDVLPALPFDAAVIEEIRDAALRGLLVRVPSGFVTRQAWQGVGYALVDEETGASAWQLQGGHSGGVTTPAVIDIPAEIRDPLVEQGQGIEPAPADAVVRRVQKFVSTDFQDGTVGRPIAKKLRVLVTDEEGRAVAGANVTFSVLGGGSVLINPALGGPGDPTVTVRSNDRGEAEVEQILGTRTDVIPRFLVLPDPNLYPIQVGLNLVTARAGSAALDEPFSTFALPDYREDESGVIRGDFEWMPLRPLNPWPQLSVASRLGLYVRDQYGNPLSNFPVRFTPRPPPFTQPPPPPGYSLIRPATQTPAHVLSAGQYLDCLALHPNPHYGDCPGESDSVHTISSPLGVFGYAVLGDSSWSVYTYDVATTLEPVGWASLQTPAWMCSFPNASQCPALTAPSPSFVTTGMLPVRVNRLGNVIEATGTGAGGRFGMWADAVSEVERVDRVVDENGIEHFMAVGTNAWRRERLLDSEVRGTALSPGTSLSPPIAAPAGDGTYRTTIVTSLSPQRNEVQFEADHWPLRLAFLPERWPELDPAHVDPQTLVAERIQIRDQPIETTIGYGLWGIAPRLVDLDPSPVKVAPEGVVSAASTVSAQLEPADYRALLAPEDVLFEVRREGATVLAANGVPGSYEIPVGLPFPDEAHEARLSVLGVASGAQEGTSVTSPPFELPRCSLLDLQTPYVSIPMAVDFVNATSCAQHGLLKFELCEAARVTLRVEGQVYEGILQSPPDPPFPGEVRFEDVALPAGKYTIFFPPEFLGPNVLESKAFVLSATSLLEPDETTEAPGTVANSARNRSVVPVGHTFVKNVDLLDGHVVIGHADLAIPGRHLGLTVQRTYSSAGADRSGLLGAGWAFSYESRLIITSCGLIVQTPDGGSQVFSGEGPTYVPQRGYHTRLVLNPDNTFDFFDKAGNRHHFEAPEFEGVFDTDRRLLYIEEPHGDRIVLEYDGRKRPTRVSEVHPESSTPVRQLELRYVKRGSFDRIASIQAVGLGVEVQYSYDEWGNLKEVRRDGPPLWRERYQYTVVNVKDRHQLLEVIDANDHVRRYEYYQASDLFPGQAAAPVQVHNAEFVRRVVESPGNGAGDVSTLFSYDLSDVLSLRWQTTVRDGNGVDARYVLNGNGSAVELIEAVGTSRERRTLNEWSATDVVKTSTTDAAGRITRFGHDAQGNLTSEAIETADLGVVERRWEYGPFNKLVSETDAAGRTTTQDVDPANGDVRSRTDAVGNVTRFEYLDHGLVESETDPRGNVATHSDHDSFGNARTIVGPEGRVVTRVFDLRGRLQSEADSLGHEVEQEWDGLDRLVRRRRLAGGAAAADEELRWEYYPGGQKRAETSPLQARTEFTIDGLGRVVREEVRVDGELLTVERSYDGNGNVRTQKDRRGVLRVLTYDALNRMVETRIASGPAPGPAGVVARQEHDAVGRKLFEVDLAGLRTDFEYDGLYRVRRRLLPETCAAGRCFEEFGYDLVGNRTLSRDIDGRAEVTAYDGLNRVTSKTDRANRTWTTVYDDPEGSHVNKSEERDPFGLVTTWRYDGLNRETEQTQTLTGGGSAGEVYTSSTAYDDAAHAVVRTDPRGRRARHDLDGLDRTTREVADVDGLGLETLRTWDGGSSLLSLRDPEGHVTRYTYDVLGRQREVEDALNGRIVSEYDAGNLKIAETDRRGVRATMSYDNLGRPLRTEVAPSLTSVPWSESKAYLDPERRQVLTDPRGKQTTVHLDGLGRAVRTTDPEGNETVTEWLGLTDRRERDKRGNVRELRFDGIGRPVLVREPEPYQDLTVTTSYDDAANRTTETDRRGIVRVTQKDSLQRLRSVTRAGVELERHAYDGNGNRVASFDGSGRETRFEYDGANRLLDRTDGFGAPVAAETTFAHDRDGNLTRERDPRTATLGQPFSVETTYDALHRPRTVTDAESNVITNGYDAEGHRTSVTEPGTQVTTFEYGEKGELTLVRQPAGTTHAPPETRVAYDAARHPLVQTDGNGHRVEMTWDDLGRQDTRVQKDAPEGDLVTDPSYDANGNMIRLVDAKGQIVTQTFDELDRLKTKTWAFAPDDPYRPWRYTTSMAYDWDPNGNLRRVDETVASGTDPPVTLSTIRTYDDLDRLTSEEQTLPEGGSVTVSFTYYPDGLRETVTDHAGRVTRYTYDGRGRLETQTQDFGTPQAAVTTYEYWPDSLLKTVRSPNGVVAHYDYDGADRLTSLVNEHDGVPVSSYAYTYDANGNRTSQVETNGGITETTTYTYDDLDRLETVTYPADASYPSGRLVRYTYDPVGNRIAEVTTDLGSQAVVGHLAGSFDAVNRLTALVDLLDPSQTTTFTWDRNGNQVTKTVGTGEPEVYGYDVGDRAVEVSRGAGILSRFQYDFEGRRRLKIGEDDLRQYVLDGTSLLAELDASPVPIEKARYSYGSDRLISLTRTDEGTRFYHFDGLGSVTALTDPAGAPVASYHLDAWGVFRNPSEMNGPLAPKNRFAFTGYQFDRETELYFAKARLYDPTVGRFTSQDSFLGEISEPPSLHRYFYGNANPLRYVDPTGHGACQASLPCERVVELVEKPLAKILPFVRKAPPKPAPGLGGTLLVAEVGAAAIAGTNDAAASTDAAVEDLDAATDRQLREQNRHALILRANRAHTVQEPRSATAGAPLVPIVKDPGESEYDARRRAQLIAQGVPFVYLDPAAEPSSGGAGDGTLPPSDAPTPLLPQEPARKSAPGKRVADPTEGFSRYLEAEGRISLVPRTQAEAEDEVRLNAAMADLRTRAAGVPRRQGRFGTHAHGDFEAGNVQTNQAAGAGGSPISFGVEEFRDVGGGITARRASGSLGVDVVLYRNGAAIRGFDLKTGRSWTAAQLAELERRFGVPITQIKTK